eukprot:scaffold7600_cov592-Prasinococcus_capsulatus_cf.AAC.2
MFDRPRELLSQLFRPTPLRDPVAAQQTTTVAWSMGHTCRYHHPEICWSCCSDYRWRAGVGRRQQCAAAPQSCVRTRAQQGDRRVCSSNSGGQVHALLLGPQGGSLETPPSHRCRAQQPALPPVR